MRGSGLDRRRQGHRWGWFAALFALALSLLGCQGGYGPFYDAPEIEAAALQGQLASSPPPLIIDVREPSDFVAGHIPAAVRVDVDHVESYLANTGTAPDRFVVVACRHGNSSLSAVAAAQRAGYRHTYSLRGGMHGWPPGAPVEQGPGAAVPDELLQPPLRPLGLLDQIVIVLAGLVLKPTYMLLSLVLVVLLWRAKDSGLRLIRASMATFFAGEAACALNYILASGTSLGLELAHGLGMVAMGTLLAWGLARLIDERVIHYEDPKAICVALRFCLRCWKREPVACPLYRLMLFVGPALAAVSLMPLSVAVVPESARMVVFGSEASYSVPLAQQLAQFRLYPLVAATSFLCATLVLLWRWRAGIRQAQFPFFVGVGFSAFALGRFVLTYALGREMAGWADLWEELTEMIVTVFVLVLLLVLWHRLGIPSPFGARRTDVEGSQSGSATRGSKSLGETTDAKPRRKSEDAASGGQNAEEPILDAAPRQPLVSQPPPRR